MDNSNTVCPVCTLYLRSGITLKSHLATHPKQKVIEALVKLTEEKPADESVTSDDSFTSDQRSCSTINVSSANIQPPTNHAFIYQQFMTSSGTQPVMNINPLNQQFAAFNTFNPQIFSPQMLNPYYFQQQQQFQIVSATSNIQPFVPSQNPAICAPEAVKDTSPVFTPTLDLPENLNNFVEASNADIYRNISVLRTLPGDDGNNSISQDEGESTIVIAPEENSPVAEYVDDSFKNETNGSRTTTVISNCVPILSDEISEINESVPQEETSIIFENSVDCENTISGISANKSEYILPNTLTPDISVIVEAYDDEPVEIVVEVEESRPEVLLNVHAELLVAELSNEKSIGVDDEDLKCYYNRNEEEEDVVSETLNIQSDEKMPPRGELSEQESNGASDICWGGRLCQEGSSGMSSSYDLLARESWEASDCSDTEMPPFAKDERNGVHIVENDSNSFNCSIYTLSFGSSKESNTSDSKEQETSSGETSPRKAKRRLVRSKKMLDIQLECSEDNTESKEMLNIKEETKEAKTANVETIGPKPDVYEETDLKDTALCNVCGEMLPSLKELSIHNRKQHKISDSKHKCKTCDLTFESEVKFTIHLKEHPLECNICGKYFFRVANMKLHLKRHMGIKPFKCNICSKSFITKQKLCEHINVHTGKLPISCNLCDQKFRRHSNLIQHRNRHHSKTKKRIRDYICHCGEIFHSKCKLNWHKEMHELKPKSCLYCLEKFIHGASLTRHIRRAHNDRYVPEVERECENVECEICKRVFLKSSLDTHLATHTGKKQFECSLCSKILSTRWNLKLHKWTHAASNAKPYKCDQCDRSFLREADYISHTNSHKSLRPYTCNYCGCKFIRKYNCLRHVREHEKGKSFKCTECDKTFHRSYYLKEHMRVHNGVRPFTCEICGKTSTTKSNHNKHLKIHHAREPVSTEG